MAADGLFRLRRRDRAARFRCQHKSSGGRSWWKCWSALFSRASLRRIARARELFSIVRDWVPVALILLAYREMDWFSALPRNFQLELHGWSGTGRSSIRVDCSARSSALGALGPVYLELCYLLVYAVAPFVVAILYFEASPRTRERRFVSVLAGNAAGVRAVSVLSLGSAASGIRRDATCRMSRTALRRTESVAGGRLRHSLQRVSERARIVGILGGLGAVRFSAGAQAISAGECWSTR